ncbi:MAG: insulinase family protein [Lachnospiraceae bacterium]|nr:insulinase family protein [Lachnospiraceae bacterium]
MRIEDLQTYEIIEKRRLEDLNSESYLLKHKKTGARVALLSNDDENKVFNIGFRTPPVNSTGVPHILEHSVLCGSKEFPIKDPFVELVKGSLNTFLNAMTYPDKTIYPVASCNDVDFQNLMHVYLDAVFYPNIYKQDKIFRQEGWHYEMEDENSELTINGVVYNEMKGAFSSPDDVLQRELMNSLYPDVTYGMESGGDPECIPELSYEEFIEFHKKYYHPSNSYIYLYGNMDMAEKLEFIDQNYLSNFEMREVDSEVGVQPPFEKMRQVEKDYPINDEDDEEKSAYFAYNMTAGDVLDKDMYVAFQILDYALCSAPGAPLKQALTDKGIGEEVYSVYDNGVRQPYFSIVAKNTSVSRREEFVNTIREILEKLVAEGIDKKALLAGINYYEFRYREADFGSYPKGLMYGLQMFDSWLYDDNCPFMHIEANETFAHMKEWVEKGEFEKLIRKYLLENNHASLVTLVPKKGLAAMKEQELKQSLAVYKASLSQEEIAKIVADTKALKEWQETPDKKEDLEKIPLLSREDMKKEAAQYVNEIRTISGSTVVFHNLFTNEIAYLRLIFKADKVPADLFPYLGVLKGMLGMLNTENYKYGDLFNEINIETGGISPVCNLYENVKDRNDYTVTLELKTKVLYPNLAKAVRLMKEMLLSTKYDDTKRMAEVLAEGKSRTQGYMISSGHSVAVGRALSYISNTSAVNDVLSGMSFYRLIEKLSCGGEEVLTELGDKLQKLAHILLRPENLMVDFVGDEKGYEPLPELITQLKKDLFTDDVSALLAEEKYRPERSKKNEGFKTAGQVQYVCRGGNFKEKGLEYTGSLRVLHTMLSTDYLWNNVRVKGGAYGCMCSFSRSGDACFVSYRDPNLEKTIDVYEKAADYIASFEADERTMTQFIIGAISSLDTPMNPAAKGMYSLGAYMTGQSFENIQRERDELLATDQEAFRKTAEYIRAFMSDEVLCVVGGGEAIEAAKEIFGKVENLF